LPTTPIPEFEGYAHGGQGRFIGLRPDTTIRKGDQFAWFEERVDSNGQKYWHFHGMATVLDPKRGPDGNAAFKLELSPFGHDKVERALENGKATAAEWKTDEYIKMRRQIEKRMAGR